jgi:hypothetical protein
MDSLLAGLAEYAIEWVDDRFGGTVAWIASIVAVAALTVGTIAFALATLTYFGG